MGVYGTRDGKFIAKKITVQDKVPVQYIIPKTVAYSTAAIMSAEDVNSNGTTAYSNVDLLIQPPYAMRLLVTANAAGTAANTDALTVVGIDAMGIRRSEDIVISSTAGTSNTSTYAYAKITSMTPNAVSKCTGMGIGFNNAVIGLPHPIASSGDIVSFAYDGGYSTTLAADNAFTVEPTYDTMTLTGTAAAKVVQVTYKSKMQE